MASEITLTFSLSGYKASAMSQAQALSVTSATFDMAGTAWQRGLQLIATSATAIALGSVTAPHWAVFHNLDSTNFLKIRNGAAGADLLKLKPGEWAPCPLLDTAIPYAIADTAACFLEYLIFSL